MKQVSMEEFFDKIGPLDVVLEVQGNYPYKTVFKLRRGGVVGVQYGGYYLCETISGGEPNG